MILTPTAVDGCYLVDLEPRADERGFFARTFDVDEFAELGLDPTVASCNLSYNHAAGTLRGMHYQDGSAPEPKLVRCTAGAVWDVALDVRPGSPTYGRHFGAELSAGNHRALFIPAECAHGYLTLTDGAEVTYQVGHAYAPSAERGLRHDDPAFGIDWPRDVVVISDKDASWPDFDAQAAGVRA